MNRDQYCTHPNQELCDCDWCRLVRADEKKEKRAENVKRATRNATARERYQVRRDLGLVRTPYGWE